MTNSKQKKELLDFWLLSRLYLLYQIVIIEQELSICVHIPAEINLLLRKQGERVRVTIGATALCPLASLRALARECSRSTDGDAVVARMNIPLGGSGAAPLHPGSLLQGKHPQSGGPGTTKLLQPTAK